MKKFLFVLVTISFWSCNSQTASSPVNVAKVVVKSFYTQDNETLKKHTTNESYESFMTVQALLSAEEEKDLNFNIINEKTSDDVAWIQFTSSYSETSETFKLISENGQWKVTEKKAEKKAPF